MMIKKCFQYIATVALNYKKIGRNSPRMLKSKPFINKYKKREINYPSQKDEWKKIEKNNLAIALNVLYITHFKTQIMKNKSFF